MTEPETTSASPRTRRLLPVFLTVLAFVVPAGAGIAIGASLLGASPVTAIEPTPTRSAVPTPTAIPLPPIEFSSESGNLRCRIDDASAWCHQGETSYYPPYENCAAEGVAIGVTAERTYWPCLSTRPGLSASVGYDVPVEHGEFTCVINFVTGATCTNRSGAGFSIEYSNGVTTF